MALKIGKVEKYMVETIEKDGVAFFGLIDPSIPIEKSMEHVKAFHEGGADIILIGGSLGIVENSLNDLVDRIKEASDLPVMLYPGNINGIAAKADALYFMSLMNSSNPYWITGAQALAAPSIAKLDIDIIPTSLLIIEPGETVGWVGEARAIPYHKPDIAVAFALAGKFLGHRVTILERGSGAPGPANPEMFRLVREAVRHPVICAGSCRTLADIEQTILAGADGIHVASIIQQASNPFRKAKDVIGFAKEAGKKKMKSGK
ncbi:MAG: geranylgeranylglyceryl/heptaprenylglyceryl phosphate synthase [Candidatus Aenigmarchaeota archaeon]|nr:geranylgeranylglyceryl/heptaprenylglyceryl phosphate synthase [Candidatus Aenigmarchaeota archaeon]